MLDSHELRQLGQRVMLSCYLAPLSFKETAAYIEHRLQIALTKPGRLFSKGALKEIYKYASGIPRLINIICDRSLLIAYSRNRKRVSGNIVRMAIRELWSRGDHRTQFPLKRRTAVAVMMVAAAVVAVLLLPGIVHRETGVNSVTALPEPAPEIRRFPVAVVPLETQVETESMETETEAVQTAAPMALKDYLEQAEPSKTRYSALSELLSLWAVESDIQPYLVSIKDDDTFFNLVSEQQGLNIHVSDGNPDLVRKLNLPAIYKFEGPDETQPIYLTLEKIHGDQAIFRDQGVESDIVIPYEALVSQFKGSVYIAWKNHLGFEGTIPFNYPKGSVIMLKMLLRDMGYTQVELTPEYDNATQAVIKDIQQRNGVDADGFVGPLTKIVLYNEKGDFPVPRLVVYEPLLNDQS
jgi:general secretion pathway protein A